MPIYQISNDKFHEELRDKMRKNSGENTPHQQVRQDMVYYYVTTDVVTINTSMQGIPTGRRTPPTVNTHYAFDEAELIRDRQNRINIATSNNAFPITRRGNEDVVFREFGTTQTEHRFSDIQTRRLLPRHTRPSASMPVVTMSGTF